MGHLPENVLVLLVTEEGNAGVLVAPDTIHDSERDEHAGGNHRIDLPELAGLDSAVNDPAQQPEPARGHFVGVELGEIGKLVELTEHKPMDRAKNGRTDEIPIAAHSGA